MTVVTVVEFQLHHKYITVKTSQYTSGDWNDSFVRTPADLCVTTVDETVSLQAKICLRAVVLIGTYCQSCISTSVSKSKSTARGASTHDNKTGTAQNKMATTFLHITNSRSL